MNAPDDNGNGKLSQVIEGACEDTGLPLKNLTVLSTQNDPYRLDTEAKHRDGKWLIDARLTPEHLEANTLYDLIEATVADYYDYELEGRVRQAHHDWEKAAREAIDKHVGKKIQAILREAKEVVASIEAINKKARKLLSGVKLPPINVPEGNEPGSSRRALISFDQDWVDATKTLKVRKAYDDEY